MYSYQSVLNIRYSLKWKWDKNIRPKAKTTVFHSRMENISEAYMTEAWHTFNITGYDDMITHCKFSDILTIKWAQFCLMNKKCISNLVHTTLFWNNHQVLLQSKDLKTKYFLKSLEQEKQRSADLWDLWDLWDKRSRSKLSPDDNDECRLRMAAIHDLLILSK
jgi:hypothetical protein